MRRAVWLPLVGAAVWSGLLLPGALYLPIGTPNGYGHGANPPRVSLTATNGNGILILVAVPLALSALAGLALYWRSTSGSKVAERAAWVMAGLVLAGAALGTVTFLIGIFVVPAGALLLVACGNLPKASPGETPSPS